MTVNSVKCEPVENSAICGGDKDTGTIVIKTIINVTVGKNTPEYERAIIPMVYENIDYWFDDQIDTKGRLYADDNVTKKDMTYESRIKCKGDCSMEGPPDATTKPRWTTEKKSVKIYSKEYNSGKRSPGTVTISCVLSKDPEDLYPEKEQVKEKQQAKE